MMCDDISVHNVLTYWIHDDGRTSGRADGGADERTGGRADERTGEPAQRTGGRTNGRADGLSLLQARTRYGELKALEWVPQDAEAHVASESSGAQEAEGASQEAAQEGRRAAQDAEALESAAQEGSTRGRRRSIEDEGEYGLDMLTDLDLLCMEDW